MRKTIVAFIVAPIGASIVLHLLNGFMVGEFGFVPWLIFLMAIYAFTILVGIPSYLVYEAFGWNRLWQYVLGGTFLGVVATIAFYFAPAEPGDIGGTANFAVLTNFQLPISGAVAAAVFWLIRHQLPNKALHLPP